MYDEFTDWVKAVLPAYAYKHGQWEETPSMATASICSIHSLGGPLPDVEDRRPRFRVILLGPRNSRGAAQQVKDDAYALAQAAMDGIAPCGAAAIRANEPSGPGYTTENRAWWSLDFQITY